MQSVVGIFGAGGAAVVRGESKRQHAVGKRFENLGNRELVLAVWSL